MSEAPGILMIDDELQLLDVVGKYLTLRGMRFEGVRIPQQALEAARKARPDVILLDLQLPGMSGWDVCRALKGDSLLRHIPIVMISGERMSPEDKAEGLKLGADDYLTKPFDMDVLRHKIGAILRAAER